jgi:hypothetical protein
MMLSPNDKVFEFNDRAIFYNMVISKEYIDEDPLIVRVVRKSNFAIIVVKELDTDPFKISSQIINRFKFKLANGADAPTNDEDPSYSKFDAHQSLGNSFEVQDRKIEKGEIGKIIIQKIKTIKLNDTEEINIDYILFWLSNEGLKRIEHLINNQLLTEVNAIMDQSTNLGIESKLEFLQKMDQFQNHYIAAQNAKEGKSAYFMKIIQSDLPSLEFRYVFSPISVISNQ